MHDRIHMYRIEEFCQGNLLARDSDQAENTRLGSTVINLTKINGAELERELWRLLKTGKSVGAKRLIMFLIVKFANLTIA